MTPPQSHTKAVLKAICGDQYKSGAHSPPTRTASKLSNGNPIYYGGGVYHLRASTLCLVNHERFPTLVADTPAGLSKRAEIVH